MEWVTYGLAVLFIITSIAAATIGSLIWVGWWRWRHWPKDDD